MGFLRTVNHKGCFAKNKIIMQFSVSSVRLRCEELAVTQGAQTQN